MLETFTLDFLWRFFTLTPVKSPENQQVRQCVNESANILFAAAVKLRMCVMVRVCPF